MSLRLRARSTEQIHAELCRAYPEEGCGVLLGRDDGSERTVERTIPLANVGSEERARRYVIAPEQFLAADREARDAGMDVVGFYHSHPDHPARPSAFDLEHAWPFYSYVIVSVHQGRADETTSWRLREDRSRFDPETIELVRDEPPGDGGRTRGESVP